MECLMMQSGLGPATRAPISVSASLATFAARELTSTFGNSQSSALTPTAGLWRTRKRPRCWSTKATNRRAVAGARLPRLGKRPMESCRYATQCERTEQAPHSGFRGVQMSAPSSMSDWFSVAQFQPQAACAFAVEERRGAEPELGHRSGGSRSVIPSPLFHRKRPCCLWLELRDARSEEH